MKKSKRKYISIYFHNGQIGERKKRDITVSFIEDEPLFEKCKTLGSSKIKKIIGVGSYKVLISEATKEGRSLGNFVKHKLKEYLDMK